MEILQMRFRGCHPQSEKKPRAGKLHQSLQDGAPKIAKLPYKWLYGRYNYS